jgi:anti-sigma factor RsiW
MFSSKLVSAAELSAFLDGETDPSRRALLREHLRTSPADAQRLTRWRQREEALRATFAPAIREGAGPMAPLARSLDQKVFPRDRRPEARVLGETSHPVEEPIRGAIGGLALVNKRQRRQTLIIAAAAFLAGAVAMLAAIALIDGVSRVTALYTPAQTGQDSLKSTPAPGL